MALNAPMFMTGFEHRQLIAGASPNNGLFATINGAPTIDTTVVCPGGGSASLKCDSTVAVHNVGWGNGGSATNLVCVIFHMRVSSAAALAGTPAATVINAVSANGNFRLDLMNTGALRVFAATGSVSQTSSTILASDQWYKIAVEMDLSTNNNGKIRCYIFDTKEELSITGVVQVTGTFSATNIGNANVAGSSRSVLNFDNAIWYTAAGDYDLLKGIGPYAIVMLNPSGIGTHGTAGNFQDESSVALTGGDTTSWNKLDDLPSVADTSTYVKQVTTTSYLEYLMAPPPVGVSVIAARALMAVFSSTTTANNISFRGYDGTTEGADLQSASVGSVTISWRGNMVPRPSGGTWAITEWLVQTARMRIGYSSDINPVPQISALAVELAVGLPTPNNQRMYNNAEARRVSWFQ